MSLARGWKLTAVLAAVVAALTLVALLPAGDPVPLPNVQVMAEAREEQQELQAPHDAMLARQLFGSEQAPTDVFARAAEEAREVGAETAQAAPEVAGADWELVGPTNIGGRILDIAVDPELADTLYVAAASGGVWRSTDAGMTYEPAWPTDLTQAIGALAITPSGVLFAGTGETGPGGGSLTYGGTGVYRSTDRGETWENVGLPESSRIGRIRVHPTDEDIIFVAASGPLFAGGGERGIYRSTDGGDSWERVLEGDNETTGGVDIDIDPSNPDKMFAAMWDHLREPDLRRYNGPGSGLYVSEDGGDTWSRVLYPGFGPNRGIGRIGVAIAPSSPNVVYATVSGESGTYAGVYKSVDGGLTWVPLAHPNVIANNVVYGWWFGRMYVDPVDPDHVFQTGLYLSESTDGGANWSGLLEGGGVHADQHAMAWDLKVPDRVYLGNDGGMYRSDENGDIATYEFATYQPFSQLYTLDVGEQNPELQVAGLQDNGDNRSYDDDGEPQGAGGWNNYHGGDGLRVLINPENSEIVYGCSQYGACDVYYDGGEDSNAVPFESDRYNWLTPIEFDPADPSVVYGGGNFLNRCIDDARECEVISPDLSDGAGRETNPLFANYGTITTVAPAAGAQTIYAGTDDGNLWYTHDGAETWTQAEDEDLPEAWITRVEVDPDDSQIAYVTYSGFRQGEDAAYVLRTTDGGQTWDNISGNLPLAPLNDVNVVGEELFVASDVGVFLSRDLGETWLRVGEGLPLAPVHEFRYHQPTDTMYAATFGRGMYKVEVPREQPDPDVDEPDGPGGDGGSDGGGPGVEEPGTEEPDVEEPAADLVGRVAGEDRVRTAVELSQAAFAPTGSTPSGDRVAARAVVLARADLYPDALAGTPLAADQDAPLLLTDGDSLHPATEAEIDRLGVFRAVILGGPAAIAPAVADALEERGIAVQRVAGANRYGTAAAIAEALGEEHASAFVAEGEHADESRGWPDALSAAPLAAFTDRPILLVRNGDVPAETAAALEQSGTTETVVVGGEAAVSRDVFAELSEAGHGPRRVAGATRYATSRAVYDEAVEAGMDPARLWLATGLNFPDALAAGPAVAASGGTLLLVHGSDFAGSPEVGEVLRANAGDYQSVTLVGGDAAISPAVADAVQEAAAG